MEASVPPSPDGLSWRRAKGCNGGNCIEVASSGGAVIVRDSTAPQGPVLTYGLREWENFVEGIKLGAFASLT